MGILENIENNIKFASSYVPMHAKFADRCIKFDHALSKTELDRLAYKVYGMSCLQASIICVTKNKLNISRVFAEKLEEAKSKLSIEDFKLASSLESVSVGIKNLKSQQSEGMIELRAEAQNFEMRNMTENWGNMAGLNRIMKEFLAILDTTNIHEWSRNFQHNVDEFAKSRNDYTEEKLTIKFKEVFRTQCRNSWDPLYQTFLDVASFRNMYFFVMLIYLGHNPALSYGMVIYDLVEKQMNSLESDLKLSEDAVQLVTSDFFYAAITSDKSWNLQLEYIPGFEEVEKTQSNFYKVSTLGEILFGDKSRNQATVNLYRKSQDPFVLVHNLKGNHEYIYTIQEQDLLKEGMYRYKSPGGDTWIGCRLIRRGDRQESKTFRLYKYISSGKIEYEEQVWGKEDKTWRTVTQYSYNPDSFTWSHL